MKTLKDIMKLIAEAVQQNTKYNNWFFDFSGHVNKLSIKYYKTGWENDKDGVLSESCNIRLNNKEQIQEAYWFIKTKLK